MDFWLVLAGFFTVVIFLYRYYAWLRQKKNLTPFKIGRLIGLVLAVISFFNALDGKGVLFLLFTIAIVTIIFLVNVGEAGALHGALITLWQLLACAIGLIIWIALSSGKMIKVPKSKDKK